jgi:hypothetical protein
MTGTTQGRTFLIVTEGRDWSAATQTRSDCAPRITAERIEFEVDSVQFDSANDGYAG